MFTRLSSTPTVNINYLIKGKVRSLRSKIIANRPTNNRSKYYLKCFFSINYHYTFKWQKYMTKPSKHAYHRRFKMVFFTDLEKIWLGWRWVGINLIWSWCSPMQSYIQMVLHFLLKLYHCHVVKIYSTKQTSITVKSNLELDTSMLQGYCSTLYRIITVL